MTDPRDGAHTHAVRVDADSRYLAVALALIVAFMVVEVAVAIVSGSLALLSDAGHMLTDAAAIAGSLVAIHLAVIFADRWRGSAVVGWRREVR